MYKLTINHKSKFDNLSTIEGESIETKVERITVNKEPIKDGAPIIFTERKDGIIPAYNIRTDRWDIAMQAMDKVNKSKLAKSEQIRGEETKDVGKAESPVVPPNTDVSLN